MAEFSGQALVSGVDYAGDRAVAVVVVGKQRPKQKCITKERIEQCQQETEQGLLEPDRLGEGLALVAGMNPSLETISSLAGAWQIAGAKGS